MLSALATPVLGDAFFVLFDEDGGNNSALVVNVTTTLNGGVAPMFELVSFGNGSACLGGQYCVLRLRTDAPNLDYDAPASLRAMFVNITVADGTGLSSTLANVLVRVRDVNQGIAQGYYKRQHWGPYHP